MYFKNMDGFPRCLFNNEDDESIGSSHYLKNSYSTSQVYRL